MRYLVSFSPCQQKIDAEEFAYEREFNRYLREAKRLIAKHGASKMSIALHSRIERLLIAQMRIDNCIGE